MESEEHEFATALWQRARELEAVIEPLKGKFKKK